MIIGIAWKSVQIEKRPDIVREMKGSGFVWANNFSGDLPDEPEDYELRSEHIGNDMLIIDVNRKIMWTGDWGSYNDMQVEIKFARFIDFARFD